MDGLLVIDKPAGPTSHDVVDRVRRATGWPRVGHTGTLDPIATGVLALVVGKATRLARFFSGDIKEYEAEIRLGWATDTYDLQGSPIDITGLKPRVIADDAVVERGFISASVWPEPAALQHILAHFVGTYQQAPPPFSAKKIDGVRAYALARRGTQVTPAPNSVTVHDLVHLESQGDRLRVRIRCSAGFYVRSFAHDLGIAMGVGAHLAALRRTASGNIRDADAIPLALVEEDPGVAEARLTPMASLLAHFPAVVVTTTGAERARHGNDLRPCDCLSAPANAPHVRVVDEQGRLLAVGGPTQGGGVLRPGVVVV